jgi:hypothetical protein
MSQEEKLIEKQPKYKTKSLQLNPTLTLWPVDPKLGYDF